MSNLRLQLPCALFGLLLAASSAYSADWPSWRGPAQNGVSEETGLVASWSPIWHAEFTGRSTPIVLDGRVFVIGRRGEGIEHEGVVAAFDAQDGTLLWEHAYNIFHTTIPFNRVGWASLAGDPETGYIYAHTVSGLFLCLDRDGKVVWSRSLTEEFGRISGYGGRVHTPVVDEDLVIISYLSSNWGSHTPGRHRYFAFDKRSGEVVWIATPGGRPLDTTYSVPVVATINGVRLLIGGNADGSIYAMKIRTGETVWGFKLSRRGINSSVVVAGDKVYAAHSEENLDNTALGRVVCIDATGNEVWRYDGVFAGYTSPVVHDGRLYITDNSANIHALDAETGQVHWIHNIGTVGKGSPVLADGRLYAPEVNGRFAIVAPGSDAAETLDLAEIAMPDGRPAELFGSPAVAYGRIYLSTEAGVYCLGDPEAQFKVSATTANYPREQAAPDATPAHLQIIPAEVVAQPGASVPFRARAFDAQGRLIGPVAAEWSLSGPIGQLDGNTLVLADAPSGGKIVASAGELTAEARIAVLPPPTYSEDFEGLAVDSSPAWIGTGTKFKVREMEGNKVLVKPPAARGLHRANTYIGAPAMTGYTIQADLLGTKKRRAVPDMGLISHRYTLDLMGYHQQLQIRTWAAELRMAKTVPFAWETGVWYTMKMQVEIEGDTAHIRGKVWPRDEPEPARWSIQAVDPLPNRSGSPGLYGYSPAEIYYDNLKVW
ncbi:MAG: PQQ-binding-like beta-propeller repeat protein [Gemmatimonadota bacterium]|nr:PQQ-binding-like beta-propeller repeat protein [Gemmatimonadota bacterium]